MPQAGSHNGCDPHELRQDGKLRAKRRHSPLVQVTPAQASAAEAPTYQPGQVIQFHVKSKVGLESGQRLAVDDPAGGFAGRDAGKVSL